MLDVIDAVLLPGHKFQSSTTNAHNMPYINQPGWSVETPADTGCCQSLATGYRLY